MSGPLVLLAFSLRRARALVLATGGLLAVFQALLVAVAASLHTSSAFDQVGAFMPAFVRQLLGSALGGFLSFQGLVCFGYFHPVVMGALVGLSIAIATTPTSEVETGFADLLLARSLARHWIITRTVVVAAAAILVLLSMMVLGTLAGLYALAPTDAPWPEPALVGSLAVNLGLLMFCWSGVAAAVGAAARGRAAAAGVVGLVALAAFMLDYVARAWRPAESVAWLSPFRYYSPLDLMTGAALSVRSLIVLGAVGAAGFALAYVLFARRDISR